MWSEKKPLIVGATMDFLDGRGFALSSKNLVGNDVKKIVAAIKGGLEFRQSRNKKTHNTKASIDLSNNKIGDKGIKYLSELKTLDYLYLSNCGITDHGAKDIANNITNLKVLNLSKNSISLDGVTAIVNKLINLESLDISENYIGLLGAKAIQKCNKLSDLNISNDKYLNSTVEMREGMKVSDIITNLPKNLRSLSLAGYVELDDKIAEAIKNLNMLKQNTC
ncbi:hypothetical protein IB642_05090 [Allofrancisella guangzhouensis]|uniref:Uncharacterized protein n=1 Tax=Allofrancisella guangzhouensis TaxID=594679 RepID=A0A0A8E2P9_9GAMM|nr:hypothetical protein [Allofrancisella guangzhouensis]AJC48273.1 hypothetical protein SD28_00640 [Allofrancisella guangzhouensis]MBK2027498.1 hypothetical protein [Allofrancisella guangzhouensis]MBK2044393.1 hypothetical protein [Allofrancisella guangzhouensis]MBK2045421.1 hypothetical protein [Allofrancisella guangzhouensis]